MKRTWWGWGFGIIRLDGSVRGEMLGMIWLVADGVAMSHELLTINQLGGNHGGA